MIRVVQPGSGSRIRIMTFYPSRITDPGVKKAPDLGSATLVSGEFLTLKYSTIHIQYSTRIRVQDSDWYGEV
jgi:hypothetical protein